jgi:hypothetical protein
MQVSLKKQLIMKARYLIRILSDWFSDNSLRPSCYVPRLSGIFVIPYENDIQINEKIFPPTKPISSFSQMAQAPSSKSHSTEYGREEFALGEEPYVAVQGRPLLIRST